MDEAGVISARGLPLALPALMVRTETVDKGRSIVLPMPGGRRSAVTVGVADPSTWAAPVAGAGGACNACCKGDGVLALTGLRDSGLGADGAEADGRRPRAVGTGPTKPDEAASKLARPMGTPAVPAAAGGRTPPAPAPAPGPVEKGDCALVSRVSGEPTPLPPAVVGEATPRTVDVADAGPLALAGPEDGVAPPSVPTVTGLWLGPPRPGAGGRPLVLMDSGDGEVAGARAAPPAPAPP